VKIILPKSLAEPLTLPWELIGINDEEMVNYIKAGLRRYMSQVIAWEATDDKPFYPRYTKDVLLSGLRVVARKRGGLNVNSVYGEIVDSESKQHVSHVYHVLFRTRKDGPVHSTLLKMP